MRVHLLSSFALLSVASAAPALASGAAEPFAQSRDPAARERALECLTQAVYYEARGESEEGQRAVAQVVLNRVRHRAYPNSVCGVVYQGSERSTGCQFTFTCDGSTYGEIEPDAWDRARRIAEAALGGNVYRPVGLATNYHATAIEPYWAPSLIPQTVVGAHIFYRRPGGSGTPGAFSQAPAQDEPDAAPPVRAAGGARAVRASYEIPVVEIPVVERQVRERAVGGRRTAAPRNSRSASRAAPGRATPRVVVRRGVRVYRGS